MEKQLNQLKSQFKLNKEEYLKKLQLLVQNQNQAIQNVSISDMDNFYQSHSNSTQEIYSSSSKSTLQYFDKNSFFSNENLILPQLQKPKIEKKQIKKQKNTLKKYSKTNYSNQFTIKNQNTDSLQGYRCLQCHKEFGIKNKSKGEQILDNDFQQICKCTKNEISNRIVSLEEIQNEEVSDYECEDCSYTTPFKHFLIKHIKNMHIQKLLQCKQCQFQASSIGNINFHIRNCHNDAIYECNQCQYQAQNLQYIKKHLKNMHSKTNNKCQIDGCTYETSSTESFNRHQRVKHNIYYKNRGF